MQALRCLRVSLARNRQRCLCSGRPRLQRPWRRSMRPLLHLPLRLRLDSAYRQYPPWHLQHSLRRQLLLLPMPLPLLTRPRPLPSATLSSAPRACPSLRHRRLRLPLHPCTCSRMRSHIQKHLCPQSRRLSSSPSPPLLPLLPIWIFPNLLSRNTCSCNQPSRCLFHRHPLRRPRLHSRRSLSHRPLSSCRHLRPSPPSWHRLVQSVRPS